MTGFTEHNGWKWKEDVTRFCSIWIYTGTGHTGLVNLKMSLLFTTPYVHHGTKKPRRKRTKTGYMGPKILKEANGFVLKVTYTAVDIKEK